VADRCRSSATKSFRRIEPFLPVQRGNVSLSNLQVINAILYVAENGTLVKVHPDGTGAVKKTDRKPSPTKVHMVAADARTALTFSLFPGQAGDAPAGRELLRTLSALPRRCRLIMDKAYEGNETDRSRESRPRSAGLAPESRPYATRRKYAEKRGDAGTGGEPAQLLAINRLDPQCRHVELASQ
jgi:Transposase DDE domain